MWPECVKDYEGFSPEEIHHSAIIDAVIVVQRLGGDGFDDITTDEAGSLIDAQSDSPTDQDLKEITKSACEDEEVDENKPEDEGMPLDRLSLFLRHMKEARDMVVSWGPYMDRCINFGNGIDACTEPYKPLFNTRKKQQRLPITIFLKPVEKTTKTPPENLEEEKDNSQEI